MTDFGGRAIGKLDGKVAIVTGAARGLGRAYAKRLAGLGAKIAIVDLNLHSYEEFEAEASDMTAESTVAEIEAMGGARVRGHGSRGAMPSSASHRAMSPVVIFDRAHGSSTWIVERCGLT